MPVGQHVANTPGLDNGYRVLGSDGKPRPDFHWDSPGDLRDVISVLTEDGVRFNVNGAAEMSQRITAAELSSLIDVLDEDAIESADSPPAELVGQQEWDWDRYAAELGLPDERLAVGRELVDLLSEAIVERDLPWKAVFRKGYVAFQRRGGYNTMIVDVYWRKTPRFAVKLPDNPAALPSPARTRTWRRPGTKTSGSGAGHSVRSTSFPTCALPSRSPNVSIHQPGRPSMAQIASRCASNSGRVSHPARSTLRWVERVYWLTAIEEEHGSRTSSLPTPTPPGALQRSAMSASFAGNGSPRVSSAMPGESRRCATSTTKRMERALRHAPTSAVVAASRKWSRSRSITQPHRRG